MNTRQPSDSEQNTEPELSPRQMLLQDIGKKLTQAREACQQSVEKPARKLNLQKRHLEALENGNWDDLPDDVYVIGFLRQYSHYLNVDLSDEIHRLKNDQYTLTKPLTFPDPPVAPSRQWAWIAGSAFILLFFAFNLVGGNHTEDDSSDIALIPAPVVTETATGSQTNPQAANSDMNQTTPVRPEMTAPSNEQSDAIETPPPAVALKQERTAKPEQPASIHHFRFDAIGSPVWLQISLPNGSSKGTLLKEVLLQPGRHVSINKATEQLWITCGNAPALQITVDGTVAADKGSLGTGKKVLRDFLFRIPE